MVGGKGGEKKIHFRTAAHLEDEAGEREVKKSRPFPLLVCSTFPTQE